MARPVRNSRQRLRPQMPQDVVPPGQPPVPDAPGRTVPPATVPPTVPVTAGPPAPSGAAVPPVTTSTVVPSRDPDALNNMTAIGEELVQSLTTIELDRTYIYNSVPLGFENVVEPIKVAAQLVDPQTGESVDVSQILPGQIEELVDTIYQLNPAYLPQDPWYRYARQIPQNVLSVVDPENFDEVNQRATALMRTLGQPREVGQPFRLATAESVQKDLLSMDLGQFNAVRISLHQTGLLKQDDIGDMTSRGISPEILRAATDAARLANTDGMDWIRYTAFKAGSGSVLGDAVSLVDGSAGAGIAVPTIQVTAADDLRMILNRTAQSAIGRALSDEETEPMISAIQSREADAQRAVFYGQGTPVEQAPAVATMAQQQIEENVADEYDVFQYGNYLDLFTQAIKGGL